MLGRRPILSQFGSLLESQRQATSCFDRFSRHFGLSTSGDAAPWNAHLRQ